MAEKLNRGLLIELVRSEPGLWNRLDKIYNNRELKSDLWNNIGKSLNTTGKIAQKTWSTLRDSYKKIQKRIYSGKTTKKYVSWPYYHAMSFLDEGTAEAGTSREDYDTVKEETEETNSLTEKPTEDDSLDERDDDEDDEFYKYDDSQNNPPPEPIVRIKRRYDDEPNNPRKTLITDGYYYGNGPKSYETDDDYLFLMSLHPYLKKLDDVQKMRLRMEILRSVAEELENSKYQDSPWHHAFAMTQQASTSDSNYSQRLTPVTSSVTSAH